MTDFDNDYVQWKAWESQAFCVLTAEQSRYFAAEVQTKQTLPADASRCQGAVVNWGQIPIVLPWRAERGNPSPRAGFVACIDGQ